MVLRPLLITVLAIGSFAFGVLRAEAISLNPPIFEFVMSPGERVEDVIRIFNEGSSALVLQPEKVNFTAKADDEFTGAPDFYPQDETRTGRELAPWIDVETGETALDPLTRTDLPFSITVPANASPGSYFGGIILRSGQSIEQGVGLVTGTAVLMLVKVEGEVVEDAALTDFSVSSGFLTHLPARFQARVENRGTVHLQPMGTVTITNIFGHAVATVPMNRELRSVLPDSARRYESTWGEESGGPEFFKQWNGFRFGKYDATLDFAYGTEGKRLTGTTSFWVVPWMVLGAFALGVLALVIGTRGFFRWYARKVIAKHEESGE